MPTWRRRDLERRHSERRGRTARPVRLDLLLALAALAVAGAALWQAMAAQSRADLLTHDLSAANARLRSLGAAAEASAARPGGAEARPAALPPPPATSLPAASSDNDL